MAEMTKIHVVFDGPPGPESGRFIECERADNGHGVRAGGWKQREDGYWVLELMVVLP